MDSIQRGIAGASSRLVQANPAKADQQHYSCRGEPTKLGRSIKDHVVQSLLSVIIVSRTRDSAIPYMAGDVFGGFSCRFAFCTRLWALPWLQRTFEQKLSTHAVHTGGVNLGYVDGHVEWSSNAKYEYFDAIRP